MLVPLTKGYFATIDKEDAEAVGAFNWFAKQEDRTVYAARSIQTPRGWRHASLHRFIGDRSGLRLANLVDHRDGDGLNNTRLNLRDATSPQNCQNARLSTASTSGVKGVGWHQATGKWQARIGIGGKQWHLGLFINLADAEAVVIAARVRLHGEFARAA